MTMAGRVAIVTGGAAGIGRSAVELLVERGARAVVADLDAERGSEVAARLGESAAYFHADVSRTDEVAALMQFAATTFGDPTVVVNNAGVQTAGSVVDLSEAEWDRVLGTNPKSCFLTTKHVVPYMRRAGGGSIVNVASTAGIKGFGGMSAYSASKGAIIALTTSLAAELAPDHIRVNCLCPGWVDTSFNDPQVAAMGGRAHQEGLIAATVPLARQATPLEIAESIVFLASDASSYITSQRLVVDGGMT